MKPFSYTPSPEGYQCSKCAASGCKLWRQYQSFHIELLCAKCSYKNQKISDPYLNEKGQHESEVSGMSDQIGWLVPAIPTEDGDTFWGYSSVPQAGVEWWQRLSTYPKEKK